MKRLLTSLFLTLSLCACAAPSVFVVNQSTQQITVQDNPDTVRSMASITKLMTAMVVLDTMPDMNRTIKYNPGYLPQRGYTVREMLTLLLVRSDNRASEVLSRNFYSTREQFIDAMNEKAVKLGMLSARFVDPSGLMPENSATARDISKMLVASGTYPVIREIAGLREVGIDAHEGRHVRQVNLTNTNKDILFEFDTIVVSKTGSTTAAGKCLALLVEKNGQQFSIVVLGEPNKQVRDSKIRHILHTQLDARERSVW